MRIRIHQNFTHDLAIRDGDLLAVLATQHSVGERDLLHQSGHTLNEDGVTNDERPGQDDDKPGTVICQRSLHGKRNAESGGTAKRHQAEQKDLLDQAFA